MLVYGSTSALGKLVLARLCWMLSKWTPDLLERILPLEMVDVASIDQVHAIDEELCSPHGFKEVPRPFHLR